MHLKITNINIKIVTFFITFSNINNYFKLYYFDTILLYIIVYSCIRYRIKFTQDLTKIISIMNEQIFSICKFFSVPHEQF